MKWWNKYHPELSFKLICDNTDFLEFDYFYYNFNTANYSLINQYLGNVNWECLLCDKDMNLALSTFYKILYCCINLFVPKKIDVGTESFLGLI